MKSKLLFPGALVALLCASTQAQIPITTNTLPPAHGPYDQYYQPGPVDEATNAMAGPGGYEFSDQSWTRKCLLRLGFQIIWALGEKERSVEWLRAFVSGEKSGEHFILQLLLETKDRKFWMTTYETTRLRHPSAVTSWDKTYEQAKLQGKLPAWQVG